LPLENSFKDEILGRSVELSILFKRLMIPMLSLTISGRIEFSLIEEALLIYY
jgi:hypothetical protein